MKKKLLFISVTLIEFIHNFSSDQNISNSIHQKMMNEQRLGIWTNIDDTNTKKESLNTLALISEEPTQDSKNYFLVPYQNHNNELFNTQKDKKEYHQYYMNALTNLLTSFPLDTTLINIILVANQKLPITSFLPQNIDKKIFYDTKTWQTIDEVYKINYNTETTFQFQDTLYFKELKDAVQDAVKDTKIDIHTYGINKLPMFAYRSDDKNFSYYDTTSQKIQLITQIKHTINNLTIPSVINNNAYGMIYTHSPISFENVFSPSAWKYINFPQRTKDSMTLYIKSIEAGTSTAQIYEELAKMTIIPEGKPQEGVIVEGVKDTTAKLKYSPKDTAQKFYTEYAHMWSNMIETAIKLNNNTKKNIILKVSPIGQGVFTSLVKNTYLEVLMNKTFLASGYNILQQYNDSIRDNNYTIKIALYDGAGEEDRSEWKYLMDTYIKGNNTFFILSMIQSMKRAMMRTFFK